MPEGVLECLDAGLYTPAVRVALIVLVLGVATAQGPQGGLKPRGGNE
jgi:hypothetical protein